MLAVFGRRWKVLWRWRGRGQPQSWWPWLIYQSGVLCLSLLRFWATQLFVTEVHLVQYRCLAAPLTSAYPTDSIKHSGKQTCLLSLPSVSRRENNLQLRTSFPLGAFSHLESCYILKETAVCLFFIFWNRVSHSSGLAQIFYASKDDLELLTHLTLRPEHCSYRPAPLHVLCMLDLTLLTLRTLCMLGKYFINWATSPD